MCLESESEFSDQDESGDDEYTVKRKGGKKKTAQSERKAPRKAVKNEKKPVKPPKTKAQSKGLYTFFFFLNKK